MFICDSSFLIAFYVELDDRVDILIEISKNYPEVKYEITPLIYEEVSVKTSELFAQYKDVFPIIVPNSSSSNIRQYMPILEPFLGKGEREVIICSLQSNKTPILDDNLAAKAWKKITSKEPMRTCRFIAHSCCLWKVIKKGESIYLLNKLMQKGFRVKKEVILKLVNEIENC